MNDQGAQKPLERPEADSLVKDEVLRFLSNQLNNDAPVPPSSASGSCTSPISKPRSTPTSSGVGLFSVPRSLARTNVSDKRSDIRSRPKLSDADISELDRGIGRGYGR